MYADEARKLVAEKVAANMRALEEEKKAQKSEMDNALDQAVDAAKNVLTSIYNYIRGAAKAGNNFVIYTVKGNYTTPAISQRYLESVRERVVVELERRGYKVPYASISEIRRNIYENDELLSSNYECNTLTLRVEW